MLVVSPVLPILITGIDGFDSILVTAIFASLLLKIMLVLLYIIPPLAPIDIVVAFPPTFNVFTPVFNKLNVVLFEASFP